MITTERFEKVNIDKLVPYARNARTHSKEQILQLRASLREFGFVNPCIVDKDLNIIAGHGRIIAAKEEGMTEVPCVFVEHLTEAQKRAYIIADNRLALNAGWDAEMLSVELAELQGADFDVSLLGFDDVELNKLLSGIEDVKEDDFDIDAELQKPVVSKLGDVWLLGKHRLICGDSTSSDTISQLMNGAEADLVLTDPPYNVNYGDKAKMFGKYDKGHRNTNTILNDNMEDGKFLTFLIDSFTRMYEHSKKGAAIYVFHADSEGYNFRCAFKTAGYSLRQCLIWAKSSLVMGRQDYQWQHEPVLYGWKDGAGHAWYSDRKQTTLIHYEKSKQNDVHPTMKPVGLCGYFISNSSKEGDIVLDPFGGSGSTLMACEQMNRSCYTAELEPKYCDVIVNRYIEQVGSSERVFLLRDGSEIKYGDLPELS
ncbi:MAG TPA: site-specific DNA-methyltransferase [Spirochaetales bacterium]|nr:site-specific DNA-methyltransferase [Spirochaetales bacterium]HQK34837.1 site-specific DNA-methyltransferase [Spirochaetales bacterium]